MFRPLTTSLLRFVLAAAAILVSAAAAHAHGTDNVVFASTTDGGGSLVGGYDYAHHVLVTPSTTIAGFTIHTANAPGLTPLAADAAANGEYALNDGTTLSFTLAAPLDAGVSVKIGATVLDAVGETALVGTFQAANPDAFHVHPTWTLTVPIGTATTRQVSFKLTAPGYGESPVYTMILSNIAPTPTATVTATATPTRTATPTVTATPEPGVTATQTVQSTSDATATVAAEPTATPTPGGPPRLDDPAAAKAAVKCASALRAAAGKHARATLAGLGKCAASALRCVQLDAGDAACLAKAGAACAKTAAKLAAGEDALAAAAAKKCAALGIAAARAAAGLDADAIADVCVTYGAPADDLAGLGRCLARQHACVAAAMLDAETPRAGEALRLLGVSPPARCLVDRGGVGAGLDDPKGAGKSLLKCGLAAGAGGAKILQARLPHADKCVGALLTCVQLRPGDAECLADAGRACAGAAKVAAAEAKLAAGVDKQCGAEPFATLAADEGARLAALGADCASYGVAALASAADHAECVRRQHACRAADLVAHATPRAAELFDLAGVPWRDAFCPDVAP